MSKQELGITKLPIMLPDGQLIGPPEKGFMIGSPPPDEQLRRIRAKEPFSSRRIAIIEASHYLSMAECETYARLFAASPELLAALEQLVADFDSVKPQRTPVPDEINEDSHWAAARAAIAKAKGQT